MRNNLIYAVFALTFTIESALAFSLPHIHPKAYHRGDNLDILVGQLVSSHMPVPFDFYKLNWCDSVANHTYDPMLGISPNEIHMSESPYNVSIINCCVN